jgi:peptidyl-prolyl cis-trans isomerase C
MKHMRRSLETEQNNLSFSLEPGGNEMKWQFALLMVCFTMTTLGCEKDHKNAKQPTPPENKTVATATSSSTGSATAKTAETQIKKDAATPSSATKVGRKAPVPVPAKRIEGVIATVDGVIIDSGSFYEEVDRISRRNPRIPADRLARIESNILQRLIDRELVKQAIQKAGIVVGEVELDASFKEYKKRFQSEEQFQNYLKHGKVTVDTIKKRLRDKQSLEKLIETKGNLAITDQEAKAFYQKNLKFYTEQAKVKASHVLLKLQPNATPVQEKAVLSRIKKIQKQLKKKGADFASIASKLSEGPSKAKGGDLGYFTAKQMLKPFSDKAFSMKAGQTSGPVKTRFGYHIIRVYDSKPERKKSFEEVEEQISKSLRNKKFFKERRRLLGELKENAKIVSNLPEPPKAQPRKGGIHGGVPRGGNPHAGIPGAPDLSKIRAPGNANIRTKRAFPSKGKRPVLPLKGRKIVAPAGKKAAK